MRDKSDYALATCIPQTKTVRNFRMEVVCEKKQISNGKKLLNEPDRNGNEEGELTKNQQEVDKVCRSSPARHAEDPRSLIPELCRHFYHLGWASGTGGGLSIRQEGRIYCAPSGVQKERIKAEDMFVLDEEGNVLERPSNGKLKCSECLSLFMVAFKLRQAGCCIHSHSVNANLITALYSERNLKFQQRRKQQQQQPGATNGLQQQQLDSLCKEFRVSHQEMIKGIKRGPSEENMQYNDTLIVPIIDNVLYERDLAGAMHEAVSNYPSANAVLVRNHGVYVWGKTWEQAKTQAECYDYLFRLKLEALKCGFDWVLDD